MEDLRPKIQDPLWSRIILAAHVADKSAATFVRLLLARWANTQKPAAPGEVRLPPPALLPGLDEGQGKQRRLPITETTADAIRHAAIDAEPIRTPGSKAARSRVPPSFMMVRILDATVPPLAESLEAVSKTKRGPVNG